MQLHARIYTHAVSCQSHLTNLKPDRETVFWLLSRCSPKREPCPFFHYCARLLPARPLTSWKREVIQSRRSRRHFAQHLTDLDKPWHNLFLSVSHAGFSEELRRKWTIRTWNVVLKTNRQQFYLVYTLTSTKEMTSEYSNGGLFLWSTKV